MNPAMTPAPSLAKVLETVLHVDDLAVSRAWYERVFGIDAFLGDGRFCAFDIGGQSIFLLFQRGGTLEPVVLPGGVIPPHDGSGHLHYAFAVDDLDAWERRLEACGVPIVSTMQWPGGGRSIYFHDPDGHVGELATRGTWPTW